MAGTLAVVAKIISALRKRVFGDDVREDASLLIERFGDEAYDRARQRSRDFQDNGPDDSGKPAGHWNRVAVEIARVTKRRIGVDTATRYLED